MEQARDVTTGDPWFADRLHLHPNPTATAWECLNPACTVSLTPCAWRKKTGPAAHRVRPYFSARHAPHIAKCTGQPVPTATKGSATTTNAMGTPMALPSRIQFKDKIQLAPRPGQLPDAIRVARAGRASGPARPAVHHHSIPAIKRACYAFESTHPALKYPLAADGCDGSTYATVFKKLTSGAASAGLVGRKIHYGEAIIAYGLSRKGSAMTIYMPGRWIKNETGTGGHWADALQIQVETASWPRGLATQLVNRFSQAIIASRRAHGLKAYVFFQGDQDVNDPLLFRVVDHRKICVLNSSKKL